jgi:hypothetical protein
MAYWHMDRATYHASVGNDARALRHTRRGFGFGTEDALERAKTEVRVGKLTIDELREKVARYEEENATLRDTKKSLIKKNTTQVELNAALSDKLNTLTNKGPENTTRNESDAERGARHKYEDLARCTDANRTISKALDAKVAAYTILNTTCDRERSNCKTARPCSPCPSSTSACTIM